MLLKNLLKKIVVFSNLPFLIILVALIWLLSSSSGLRCSFFVLHNLIAQKISVSNLRGSWLSTITADEVSYQNKDFAIAAKDFALAINLSGFLSNKIYLKNLQASSVNILLKTPDEALNPELIQQITNIVRIDNAALNNIAVIDGQHKKNIFTISGINVKTISPDRTTRATSVEVTAPGTNLNLVIKKGVEQEETTWQLKSNLNKLYTPWQGNIDSSGAIKNLKKLVQIDANVIANNIKIADFKLHRGQIKIVKTNSDNQSQINLEQFYWQKYLFDKINITGTFINEDGVATLALNLAPGNLQLPSGHTISFSAGTAKATIQKNGTKIAAALNLKNEPIPLTFALFLPKYYFNSLPLANQKIAATFAWQPKSLNFVSAILPQAEKLAGNLQIAFKANGTVSNLKWQGQLLLTNFSCYLPDLNTTLSSKKFEAAITPSIVNYSGIVNSGAGSLDINGEIKLKKTLPATITIKGKNFLAVNNEEAKVIVDPDIKIITDTNKTLISGEIFVPEATIKDQRGAETVALPNDVIFVSEKQTQNLLNTDVQIHIKLALGDNININIMGLKAKLGGHLLINDALNTITTATGTLVMQDASYNIYGKSLTITSGSFNYTNSPITNPLVNFQAVRHVTITDNLNFTSLAGNALKSSQTIDATVGINVQGRLDNLKTTLFSVPSGLSSTDILSYLFLGQSSDQIGSDSSKTQLLLNAATALNFGGVSKISKVLEHLKSTFGLSEISLVSDQAVTKPSTPTTTTTAQNQLTSNTSVMLGKYLSPKIYLSYSMGLMEQTNLFRISYLLGKNWTIQSETGSNNINSVDLLFRIEQD